MADNPEARPKTVTAIPISDLPHAPFIFYENAPAAGFTNGIVNITLSANRTCPSDREPRPKSFSRVLRSKRTGKTYARSDPYRFLPQRSFGSIHSTCLWS